MTDEHRVTGRRMSRFPDPERSDDPRVIAVLDSLRSVQIAPPPRAHFRAELRAQLVAITPRLVAEGADVTAATGLTSPRLASVATATAVADRPRPRPRPTAVAEQAAEAEDTSRESFWRRVREIPLGRPLAVAASIVTVLALVLGGAVWMSQDSVPGDALYSLKRASERFELSTADNDTERAQLLLQFATTRVDEANELISNPSASAAGSGPLADGRLSGQTSDLIAETLADANDNTMTASRLLGGVAVQKASATPLAGMKTWAPEQIARLSKLRRSLPAGTELASSASKSAVLVKAVATRAAGLRERVACKCLGTAPTDSLGPIPTGSAPTTPRTTTTPKAPKKSSAPGGTRGGSSTAPGTSGGQGSTGSRNNQTTAPRTSTPKLPKLPLPSVAVPSAPKTTQKPLIDLCKVSLLGIKICPSKTP